MSDEHKLPFDPLLARLRRGTQTLLATSVTGETSYKEVAEIISRTRPQVERWVERDAIPIHEAEQICLARGWLLEDVWPLQVVLAAERAYVAKCVKEQAKRDETASERRERLLVARRERDERRKLRRAREAAIMAGSSIKYIAGSSIG